MDEAAIESLMNVTPLDAYNLGVKHERERIIALIENMMRTSSIIRNGDTGAWVVLSDMLRDIRNPE